MISGGSDISGTVRPLRWWSQGQLEALAQRLGAGWHAWCQHWDLEAQDVTVSRASEARYSCVHWHAGLHSMDGSVLVWLGSDHADAAASMAACLYEHDDTLNLPDLMPGGLARHAGDAAWRDWLDEMVKAIAGPIIQQELGTSGGPPPSHNWTWSGALHCEFSFSSQGSTRLHMHVSPEQAGEILQAGTRSTVASIRAPLTPVPDALTAHSLRLSVQLKPVGIDIGTLQSLRPGDVLPIPHALHEPAHVLAPQSVGSEPRLWMYAHLGRRQQHVAIECLTLDGPARSSP